MSFCAMIDSTRNQKLQKKSLVFTKSKKAVLTLYADNLTATFNLPRYSYSELLEFDSFFDFVKYTFQRFDVNIVTRRGESVLQWLCRVYQEPDLIRVVQYVCDLGANVNYSHPKDHNSPLMTLVSRSFGHFEGTLEVAAELIKRGADVNHKNIDGRNAFNLLCFDRFYKFEDRASQNLSFMKLLVSSNIDISNVDEDGQDNLNALLTKRGNFNYDHLFFVYWPAVELLLNNRYVFNPPLERTLWLIAFWGEADIIKVHSILKLLIDNKVNVNHPEIWNLAPYSIVSKLNVLAVLLETNGAACMTEEEEECWRNIVELLIDADLDINKACYSEETPGETTLMIFCYLYRGRNFLEILRILLENGADPNAQVKESCYITDIYDELFPGNRKPYHGAYGVLDFFLCNKYQQHNFDTVNLLLSLNCTERKARQS